MAATTPVKCKKNVRSKALVDSDNEDPSSQCWELITKCCPFLCTTHEQSGISTPCTNGSGTAEDCIDNKIDKMELAGKVALITGAAQGLGKSFAQSLLLRGARVCLLDLNQDVGEATSAELKEIHGNDNVTFSLCDVTKDECFKESWDKCTEYFDSDVNILVNNAGIGNEQNWALTYDINVGGTTRGTLLAMERMGKNKGGQGGTVINIASVAGLKSLPFGPIYSASKYAIVGLSRSLGHPLHLAISGVTVQCLCPSLVQTAFLGASMNNAFSPEIAKAMLAHAGKVPLMGTEEVARGFMQLLDEQKNGGVLVVEASKEPYYVDAALPV